MKRRILLFVPLLLAIACNRSTYVSITGYAQGGEYIVKLNTRGCEKSPEQLKQGIDSILNRVDFSVSGYNRESLLSKFNKGETIVPDEIFSELYSRSRELWKQSKGALDVAAGPLFDAWGFGFTTDSLPSPAQVEKLRTSCGMARLKDSLPSGNPADLLLEEGGPLPRLNYNAIAQGYSSDLIARYLYSQGVGDMLINIGGEIFCDGLNPSGKPWTLGIDRPEDGNNTPGASLQGTFCSSGGPQGIVTSGNYRKFYIKDGHKYSHTIDPRSGYPVEHTLLCASVIAPDATTADALATICMVLGKDEALSLIESLPQTEVCLIYDEDGVMKSACSEGFVLL